MLSKQQLNPINTFLLFEIITEGVSKELGLWLRQFQ